MEFVKLFHGAGTVSVGDKEIQALLTAGSDRRIKLHTLRGRTLGTFGGNVFKKQSQISSSGFSVGTGKTQRLDNKANIETRYEGKSVDREGNEKEKEKEK